MLGWGPLAWLGTFAYSTYLIHAPLLQIVTQYFISRLPLDRVSQLLATLTMAPATIAMCFVFFLFCERPFMRLRDRPLFQR